ncbi:MAG: hypothetical protein A3E87_10875 [Gammaproteobacteria bacterium RIFCSPHIGHO2_12_FULL_35_23]|nr:MAG: hypothetical protein A3E87_10875 [Gammaproteobacteria bacterium RIFCSPHIGHO2_12_FULL_35_23]
MYYSKAFGLSIESDLKIPEFLPNNASENSAVIIKNSFSPIEINANGLITNFTNELSFEIKKIGRFSIKDGNRIFYQRENHVSDEELRLFILGSCFGCLLQQRGYIVLHGNAITTDETTCKIIVGNQGAGKSTTAAWYHQQGAKILADDVCAVTFNDLGQPIVIPSYPQIKLWQASADLLGISTRHLNHVRPQQEKFSLPIVEKFWQTPLPLTEIVEIHPSYQEIKVIQGLKKLGYLKEHSYRYQFLEKMQLTAHYLKQLMRLADKITFQCSPRIQLNQKINA